MAKQLDRILIEVKGGPVAYFEVDEEFASYGTGPKGHPHCGSKEESMNDKKRLEKIASFGDVVCSIPSGIAVANPQDNEDGYYLEVSSVAEAYNEMEQAELLKSEEEWKAE